MELDHDEVMSLVPAYMLGALPPEEMPLVRAHILSCDECMAEADSYAEASSGLALTVNPAPVPKGFADRVLASADPTPEHEQGKVVALRPRRMGRVVTAIFGAAAVIAIAILGASLVRTQEELGDYQRVVSSVLRSDEGMELTGNGAVGRMVPRGQGSVFVVAGMQEAPKNHTYQLWLIDDGTPVSAGTFEVAEGVALLESDHSLDGFEGAAVTIEPGGGSSQPTTDPIMVAG